MSGDEFYDDEVTSGPIYRPPFNETYCADCGHGRTHHGHVNGKTLAWVDEGRCFVWVPAERTASGRKRGRDGCMCKGWRA